MINVSFLLKKYYRFKSSLQKKLYICPVFNDIDHEWRTSSVRTMSIYNDKNYIDNVINLNLIKKQSKMTKNESKLLSIQGIAKASAFCLLLSAFSVDAAMAVPASAGTVDEVMVVQQGKKVTGMVVDGAGEPVIGANVVVKGTTNGTITDFDGNYSLEGVSANDILVVSYIGYLSQEIPVENQSSIKVTLKEDTQTLDEVVVVGYGTMRKSDVTGSIGVAKGDDLTKNQNFSALDNLRGKVSGVNIFSNSSQPGAYSNRVVIRGMATINASSNPLYVVDGVVMENFDLVNPNDIESMEVLKDASAAAIYGARGANGVIMVTTKRGKKDGEGVQVSYQGSVSASHIARKMDTMNAQEWCDAFMIGLENENKWQGKNWSLNRADWFNDSDFFDANGNPLYDTNWQDEATRTAVSHNHQLNIQQAGKSSSMGAFLNYTDQQGIVNNTYNKRINAKLAYDANPTKWLSTAVNVLVNHTWGRYTPEDGGGQEARRTMIEMVPWMPIRDKNGKYTTSTSSSIGDVLGFEGMSNPVMILDMQKRMRYNTQVFGNAALTFHLAEGLDLKTQLGLDHHNKTYRGYSSIDLNNISMPNGWAEYQNWNTLYWQEETYLTYNKVFGDHRINAMAGLSWQERVQKWNKARTEGFSDDFFEDNNMSAGTTPASPESSYDRWAMNSYFLRFAYTYKDRYSATVTGRVDGSSKFGENNKYAFFPSAGLAWNISQEDFMQDQSTISNLKLHTSYGLTGNSEIDTYRSLARVSSGTLLINDIRAPYSYISSMANPDLKWESTAMLNIGLDFSLFNGRLGGTIEWYDKRTSDMLYTYKVPTPPYVYDRMQANVGDMKNTGIEVLLNLDVIRNKTFNWNMSLNLSHNKNEITKLSSDLYTTDRIYTGDPWIRGASGVTSHVVEEGRPVGQFFMLECTGIKDGKYIITDLNGDGEISDDDRTYVGDAQPDLTFGWQNNFTWKNWDFSFFFRGTIGNKVLNNPRAAYANNTYLIGTNALDDELTYTMKESSRVCSYYLENGSFIRLDNLALGYTFDAKKINWLDKARLYFAAQNLFVITGYKGLDPEVELFRGESSDTDAGLSPGIEPRQFFPKARTFTLGVNLTF